MASPGLFGGGERSGHLKSIMPGGGRQPRRMVTKFKILKRIKGLENESIFQNSRFSCQKNLLLLRKISEYFQKLFLKFQIFYFIHAPYKCKEIFDGF